MDKNHFSPVRRRYRKRIIYGDNCNGILIVRMMDVLRGTEAIV